jgi:hypothetical protein
MTTENSVATMEPNANGVSKLPTSPRNPLLTFAPSVKVPYTPQEALDDIPGVSHALELFLASHMVESEEYCHKMDENKCVLIVKRCGAVVSDWS